jgi:transcription initiation factor TFIIIB Brf1 subunit/transcription initiation factor TFIIB
LQEKCPQCGKNPLVYDLEYHEIVCPRCGLVIDDRPLVSVAENYKERWHRGSAFISVGADAWLHISLEIVRSMYKRVFFDTCTLKTAEIILNEIHENVPRQKLPDYELAARFAVLVASRRCGETVELESLFESLSELSSLLRHDYLRRLYVPPDRSVQIAQHALRIAKCLEERGVQGAVERVSREAGRLDRGRLHTTSARPLSLAIALVYSVLRGRADTSEIAECAGTTVDSVKKAVERYACIFS